jgi:hypothetical protein
MLVLAGAMAGIWMMAAMHKRLRAAERLLMRSDLAANLEPTDEDHTRRFFRLICRAAGPDARSCVACWIGGE